MPVVKLNMPVVKLINGDKERTYDTIVSALAICHNTVIKDKAHSDRIIREYALKLGHESTLEHGAFTFEISGISRIETHQHVRHRIASYSQRSQRYCNEENFKYVTPPSIIEHPSKFFRENRSAQEIYDLAMEMINVAYLQLTSMGIPKEDARYLLPGACETEIITTMNIRELRNFFKLRTDKKAQWEIRAVARLMLHVMLNGATNIFFEDLDNEYQQKKEKA